MIVYTFIIFIILIDNIYAHQCDNYNKIGTYKDKDVFTCSNNPNYNFNINININLPLQEKKINQIDFTQIDFVNKTHIDTILDNKTNITKLNISHTFNSPGNITNIDSSIYNSPSPSIQDKSQNSPSPSIQDKPQNSPSPSIQDKSQNSPSPLIQDSDSLGNEIIKNSNNLRGPSPINTSNETTTRKDQNETENYIGIIVTSITLTSVCLILSIYFCIKKKRNNKICNDPPQKESTPTAPFSPASKALPAPVHKKHRVPLPPTSSLTSKTAEAIKIIQSAVIQDENRNFIEALKLYEKAITIFKFVLRQEQDAPYKLALAKKIDKYMRRIKELKQLINNGGKKTTT